MADYKIHVKTQERRGVGMEAVLIAIDPAAKEKAYFMTVPYSMLETLIDDLCHAKWLIEQQPITQCERELPKLAISGLGVDEDDDV